MDKQLIGDLVGERVALDVALPTSQQKVGEYTLLGNPDELLIPEKFKATVKELGDANPMFVTVAVPIGKSRILSANTNPAEDRHHRLWTEPVMDTLVTRIRESALPGYRGHVPDLDNLPDAAVLWLSATKGEKPTGERAVLARGYVYDVNNNRYFLKTGAFNTVSPLTMARMTPEVVDEEPLMVVEQANWLSLDFVRKNTEGLRGAAVVTMEGASQGMKFSPEQLKLISELAVTDLETNNPSLVREIASKAAATSDPKFTEIIDKQTTRISELVRENADLALEKSKLDQIAIVLGCKSEDVLTKLADLKELQSQAATFAKESALAKLGTSAIRDVVTKRLKDAKFGSPKEAEDAVAAEVASAKEYIAAFGIQNGLGGVNATGNTGGSGSGVLSSYGASLVQGG